jgi:hypothetical protein
MSANVLGGGREANYDAVPRAVSTDPHAAVARGVRRWGLTEELRRTAGVARTS